MDEYKAEMNRHVGGLGLYCECCNLYKRNHNGNKRNKRTLNKMARQGLKRTDKKTEMNCEEV